jgi:hypothetical protein
VPSFLPFLPNSSFWIPSSEETIKDLQVLAERIKVSKPSRQDRSGAYRPSASSGVGNWSSDKGKLGAVSKVAEWSLIQQTERLLASSMAMSSRDREGSRDSLIKSMGEKGQKSSLLILPLHAYAYTDKEIYIFPCCVVCLCILLCGYALLCLITTCYLWKLVMCLMFTSETDNICIIRDY